MRITRPINGRKIISVYCLDGSRPKIRLGVCDEETAQLASQRIQEIVDCWRDDLSPSPELNAWMNNLPKLRETRLATFGLCLTAMVEGAGPLKGSRPNIILVMTDDQGYGDLSCHGHPFLKTPNLDRLHSQSTRFTSFHASPICARRAAH